MAQSKTYTILPSGALRVSPDHERRMLALWKRSSVMSFSDWDPPRRYGIAVMRWHDYYEGQIRKDVRAGRLSADDGESLRRYLEVLGT